MGLRQKPDNQQANKKVPGEYFQFSDDYLPPAFFPVQSNFLTPRCGTCISLDQESTASEVQTSENNSTGGDRLVKGFKLPAHGIKKFWASQAQHDEG